MPYRDHKEAIGNCRWPLCGPRGLLSPCTPRGLRGGPLRHPQVAPLRRDCDYSSGSSRALQEAAAGQSRGQEGPFCTREAAAGRSRGQEGPFCTREAAAGRSRGQGGPFCTREAAADRSRGQGGPICTREAAAGRSRGQERLFCTRRFAGDHELLLSLADSISDMKQHRFATRLIATLAGLILLAACGKTDDSDFTLSGISFEEWPLTDCSTSTRPVRDLVAYKLLGIPYQWEEDWMGSPTYIITPKFQEKELPRPKPLQRHPRCLYESHRWQDRCHHCQPRHIQE